MRISDWSSDVCSSDLFIVRRARYALQRIRPIGGRNGRYAVRLGRPGEFLRRMMLVAGHRHRIDGRQQSGEWLEEAGRILVGEHAEQDRKSTRLNSSH